MMDVLRRFRDNPENPKNVQIPFYVLIGMEMFLSNIDTGTLTDDEKAAHKIVLNEIEEKLGRVRNRQAYSEVVRAPKKDKQAALDAYHSTKKMGR